MARSAGLAEQPLQERQSHAGYLKALLAAEIEERQRNTVSVARPPRIKTVEELDFAQSPKVAAVETNALARKKKRPKGGSHQRCRL